MWLEVLFELFNIQHAPPLLRDLLGVRPLHHLTGAQGKHGVTLLSHHSSWGNWASWGHWDWSMSKGEGWLILVG